MAVVCGECGKVYPMDPELLKNYSGHSFRVKCDECGSLTQLKNMEEPEEEPVIDIEEIIDTRTLAVELEDEPKAAPDEAVEGKFEEKIFINPPKINVTEWLRLTGKMVIPFLFIPVILIFVSLNIAQNQMDKLSAEAAKESRQLLIAEGAEKLMQKARNVAKQCEIYLRANPDLLRGSFFYNPEFKKIAVQSFGKTGYTCLFQEPEPELGRGWIIWAHPNPELIGNVDKDVMRKIVGPHYDDFMNLLTSSQGRKEVNGVCKLLDPDGKLRKKILAISPISVDNAPFFLMTTASVYEFGEKNKQLISHAKELAKKNKIFSLGFLISAILIIGFCILSYSYRLTRNIQYLAVVAHRISRGNLQVGIYVKSNDEIGKLADAISRIQDSLRFSLERSKHG